MIRPWLGGLLLLGAWGCTAQPPDRPFGPAAAARRVLALSPHATELVFAVGAGDSLVGVVAGSDHPPRARSLPVIGDAVRLDRERILALRPDLAVAWGAGNREEDLQWLRAQGLGVYRSNPRRIEEIAADLQAVGELTGRPQRGREAADAFRAGLERLRREHLGASRLNAFYALWAEPLMTVGGPSLITQAMDICGLASPFAQQRAETLTLTWEALLAARPEVMVLPGPVPEEAFRRLIDPDRSPGSPAVAIHVDADLLQRPGPRMLVGIERLCRARAALAP